MSTAGQIKGGGDGGGCALLVVYPHTFPGDTVFTKHLSNSLAPTEEALIERSLLLF